MRNDRIEIRSYMHGDVAATGSVKEAQEYLQTLLVEKIYSLAALSIEPHDC
jgi:hypothetical protein